MSSVRALKSPSLALATADHGVTSKAWRVGQTSQFSSVRPSRCAWRSRSSRSSSESAVETRRDRECRRGRSGRRRERGSTRATGRECARATGRRYERGHLGGMARATERRSRRRRAGNLRIAAHRGASRRVPGAARRDRRCFLQLTVRASATSGAHRGRSSSSTTRQRQRGEAATAARRQRGAGRPRRGRWLCIARASERGRPETPLPTAAVRRRGRR